jgi:hypothetical protein
VRWLQSKPDRGHASLDARAPLRRSDDLVIEALDDELLVYDRINKRAHCLSAEAARVWQACDGSRDATTLSGELGLPRDVIRRALDELEASELLDRGLELVDVVPGNGNGRAVTRRELAVRSAKVGTAVATAPLILSITAPTAMAAATPTPHQCQVYTTQDCGTSSGCGAIAGCCCCCQGATGSCKLCSATSFCESGQQPCSVLLGGTQSNCSTIGSGGTPTGQGCCGIPGANSCGCGFAATGVVVTGTNPPPGGTGTGAGCCDPANGSGGCAPGSTTTCVPCCNGTPIPDGARLLCCTPGTTSTC